MTRCLIALACLTLCSTTAIRAADEYRDIDPLFGEWKTLFNGKDLTGWTTAKLRQHKGENKWKVEDGTLTNGKNGQNDICTVEEFADYELEIEYKIPGGGNSGVYLRGVCEIQIADSAPKGDKPLGFGDAGAIYGKGGRIALVNAQKPAGQWNKYRVIHVDHHITVWHNGVLIQDNVYQPKRTGGAMGSYTAGPKKGQRFPEEPLSGPLMLQGDHSLVWYRNIRIRPLFAKKGWKSIFNGKDLSQFTGGGDKPKGSVDTKIKALTNTATGGGGHDIWTKEAFENFAVYYQYKPDTGKLSGDNTIQDKSGNSGFYLRNQWEIQIHKPVKNPNKHHDGALYSYKAADRPSQNGRDRWNHMFVTCIDGKISAWRNGVLIHDKVVLPTRTDSHGTPTPPTGNKAPFKLQGDHGKVWFANLRILPLP